jgi:hypothetical protein
MGWQGWFMVALMERIELDGDHDVFLITDEGSMIVDPVPKIDCCSLFSIGDYDV